MTGPRLKAAAGDPEEGRRVRSREETLQELAGMIIQFDQLFVDAKRSDTGMATLGKGFFWEWATRCRDVLALIDADSKAREEEKLRWADKLKERIATLKEDNEVFETRLQFEDMRNNLCHIHGMEEALKIIQGELSNTQTEPEGSRA